MVEESDVGGGFILFFGFFLLILFDVSLDVFVEKVL